MHHNVRGALLALLAFAVYATNDVIVKFLGGDYSPVQTIFFSTLFSFPLAVLMIMRDQAPGTLRPVHPGWMMARTVATLITGVTAFYAFSVLPLAQTYTILFASPLLITLLAIPVLGERIHIRRGIAIVVGLIGVVVALRPGETQLGLGHMAAVVAAIGGSFASVVVRRIGSDERPIVIMLYPMMANFFVMGAALGFVYEPMPATHIGLVAIMAILGSAAGLIIIGAYKSGEAIVVAPMQYSQIIWAAIFGYFIFSESVDLYTAVGAMIIIASGLYIVLREGTRGTSSKRPVLQTRSRAETGTSPRISTLLDRAKATDSAK
ncbi:MAG TPA: DMT family transporter [Paracoccaceae bacterium]|nr:DMT family transporter [Paracoccaceae bacterium]